MSRRHDIRRIKSHLTYTASEIAITLDVNIRTVRKWTKDGLNPLSRERPFVFAPDDIRAFLRSIEKDRQPCAENEIFCVACKVPRVPVEGSVRTVSRNELDSDRVGECPKCGRKIYRRNKRGYVSDNPPDLK